MRMSFGTRLKLRNKDQPIKTLQAGDRCAQVVAIAAQKGGVGKTTTTVSLAAAFARFHGLKVLVVDLDPQSHASLSLADQIELGGGALSDVLIEQRGLEVDEIATDTTIDGLRITPADPSLQHAEDRLGGRIGKELVLKKALQVTRTRFDLILLDCPPHIGTLTVNALVAADHVLVPCNPAALAMSGVTGLVDAVEEVQGQLNPELNLLGVVLTKVDGRNSRTNEAILGLVEDSWGELLVPVQVGVNNSLSRAQLEGQDIFRFDPHSRAASQYKDLAAELLRRMQG